MHSDKRKKPRRAMHYPAWLDTGPDGAKQTCLVTDVSETGARLEVKAPAAIPRSFMLQLGNERAPQRRCNVVWRRGNEIGIRFEQDVVRKRQRSSLHSQA